MGDTPTSAEAPALDLVKVLLFRSSDEAGIGWTPSTVVHVPAGLLHNAADTITALRAEVEQNAIDLEEYRRDVERLRAALEEIAGYRMKGRSSEDIARAALKEDRT